MRNFATHLWRRLQQHREARALVRVAEDGGLEVRDFWTWTRRVQRLALALLDSGFEEGERVAMVAKNSQDWIDLGFAVWLVGGCLVPLVPERDRRETLRACARSGSTWIVVDDAEALAALRGGGEGLPGGLQWVCMEGEGGGAYHALGSLDARGRSLVVRGGVNRLGEHIYGVRGETPALIVFDPERADDPHGAYFSGEKVAKMLGWLGEDLRFEASEDRLVSALNYGWYASWLITAAWLLAGGAVCQEASIGETVGAMEALAPTHLICGSAFLEYRTQALRESVARLTEMGREEGQEGPLAKFLERVTEKSAQALFYEPFKRELGGELRQALVIGEGVPEGLREALARSELALLAVWGVPEAGVTHMERPGVQRGGSVGRVVQGYACKVEGARGEQSGEVLVRSEALFDGYWDEMGPREVRDGWLRTGCIGSLSSGYLTLRGLEG